jgi:hypothetical protein
VNSTLLLCRWNTLEAMSSTPLKKFTGAITLDEKGSEARRLF